MIKELLSNLEDPLWEPMGWIKENIPQSSICYLDIVTFLKLRSHPYFYDIYKYYEKHRMPMVVGNVEFTINPTFSNTGVMEIVTYNVN